MADQYREPIEESVDLREKFVGGGAAHIEMPAPVQEQSTEHAQEHVAAEKSSAYNHILTKAQSQGDDGSDDHAHTIVQDAKRGASHVDVASQVTHLMDLAQAKGVTHAVRVAQRMSDYYVLDKMHDQMLSDQFHAALSEKDLI